MITPSPSVPIARPVLRQVSSWVGLIPFAKRGISILGAPPLPYLSQFLETNVRLYSVDPDGRRGVVFRSLEADRLLPVLAARATYRLPYMWSAMRLARRGDERTYTARRRWPGPAVSTRIRVRIGEPIEATPLDHFLTARWGLHSAWGDGTAWAPVAHERWPLHAAELLDLDDELVCRPPACPGRRARPGCCGPPASRSASAGPAWSGPPTSPEVRAPGRAWWR